MKLVRYGLLGQEKTGVGMGLKSPQYLHTGQVLRLGIDNLGTQTQKTVQA